MKDIIIFFLCLTTIITFCEENTIEPDTERQDREREWGQKWISGIINKHENTIIYSSLLNSGIYFVNPGDRYRLEIYNETIQVYSLTVSKDNSLEIPFLGTVNTYNREYSELRNHIISELKKRLLLNYVEFIIELPAQFEVFVTGGVNNPGIVLANPIMRLGDALILANGIREGASVRQIRMARQDGSKLTIDITRFALTGKNRHNPFLKAGDTIYVPKATHLVNIKGKILFPGVYEILSGETISDLIEIAGGFIPGAITHRIEIIRFDEYERLRFMYLDLIDNKDFILNNGDTVVVPSATINPPSILVEGALFGKQNESLSNIEVPTRVLNIPLYAPSSATLHIPAPIQVLLPYLPGMTLYDVLVKLGGPTPYAIIDNCKIARDGEEFGISFNVKTIWEDPERAKEVNLQPNDHIIVPMADLFVVVMGEVNSPSVHPLQIEGKVSDYIFLSGGLTQKANPQNIFQVDRSGKKIKKVEFDDALVSGDIIVVESRVSYQVFDFFNFLLPAMTSLFNFILAIYNLINIFF